jgi:hypothetical protein
MTTSALHTQFCKEKKTSKTETIERGIELLIDRDSVGTHPAYLAYKNLNLVPESISGKSH